MRFRRVHCPVFPDTIFTEVGYDKHLDFFDSKLTLFFFVYSSSHKNVHSQNRPHYCPVKSCNRSEGGRGFKRKNEMIRHGLVHKSPGYICPFCPEREHKYPRPDNLQRFVFFVYLKDMITEINLVDHPLIIFLNNVQACSCQPQ